MTDILTKLREPFHPSYISFKPGATKGDKAMALAYADPRAYMHRLDEVCGAAWEVAYEPWGVDRIICKLTISGVTRSSTGEMDAREEKSEIGGTSAEAQSFKRACAFFGLGRYLYDLPSSWADFDPATKRFTDGAKAKLEAMLMKHYREATKGAQQAAAPATSEPVQTVDGVEVIKTWANRTEAEMWAVKVGACKNEFHARESMNNAIALHGGTVTKDNYLAIYESFYQHQLGKLDAHEAMKVAA